MLIIRFLGKFDAKFKGISICVGDAKAGLYAHRYMSDYRDGYNYSK